MGEKIRGKKWKNLIKNNECILPFGLINKKINGKEKNVVICGDELNYSSWIINERNMVRFYQQHQVFDMSQ